MHLRIVRSQFGVVDHRQGLLLASVNQMHASNKIDCIYVLNENESKLSNFPVI
jgi:hypothetical protein